MALDKDWKDYDPVARVGDPSTPITAVALEDLEARVQAAINAVGAVGRPSIELSSTAIVLDSTHFNSEIVTMANSPVTVKIPINLGGSGSVTVGIRQAGTGTVNIIWDAGVTVGAPNGTQIKDRNLRGQITWLPTANQYTLEGEFIQSGSGSGGGGGLPPGGGVVPVPDGFLAAAASNVASGTSIPIPAGGDGDRTYVAVVGYDTGSTPDISALITPTAGWSKREAGYGTSNGGAVFTVDVADGVADPAALVLTWTGGNRTTFYYAIGVYNDAEYLDSDMLVRVTADSVAPTFPSVSVQAGGQHIVAATNSAGLASDPPSGYTERVDLSTTGIAQYANVTVDPWASAASGALTVVPPPGAPGETYIAVVHYDNLSGVGDASANIILDSPTGDWTKEATKWVSPQGSAVFYRRIAVGDVNPTVQFTGAARTVGYVCIKVTDADAADAIQATAVGSNASSDASNAIFPTATDVARGLRMLVAYNNGPAVITAPQSYTQRANFVNEGAVFTRPSTGVTADIVYRDRSDAIVNGTALPITRPAASQVGDVHVLSFYVQSDNMSVTYDVPGWTLIRTVRLPEPVSPDLVGTNYYYRVDDGLAFADITWDLVTTHASATIHTYSGVDTASPIHTHNGQPNAANATITVPSITTTVDGCMLLWIGTTTDGGAVTGPATYTARNTVAYDMQVWEKTLTTAGTTGAVTGTQTDASDPTMGAFIALRPAKMTATTAAMTGANRLWHAWSIIVKPAAAGLSLLGLQLADRAMTATGASGILAPSMAATPVRSSVGFAVSLGPSGVVTDPDPDPTPTDKIVTALSTDGSGVVVVSVPAGTVTVTVAEMDNIANPAITNFYSGILVAVVTAGGYKYVPHAGTPVVDMIAVDINGLSIPPPPTDAWAGRLTTNVVNTPGVSADNTTIPSAPSITDAVGATWTLVGGVVFRNGAQTISSEVVQVLFKYATAGVPSSGVVYQKNAYGGWWRWQDNSTLANPWISSIDPTGAVTPPVDPGGGGPDVQIIGICYEGGMGMDKFDQMFAAGIGYFRCGTAAAAAHVQSIGAKCAIFFYDGGGAEGNVNGKGTIGFINPATYASQARALVLAYGLTRFEVMNEPDGAWFWNDSLNHSHYVAILKATYEALAGTGCKVVCAFEDNYNWDDGVKAQGALNYCHEVVTHPYGGASTPRAQSAAGDVASIDRAFQKSGKKVFLSELGWPTAVGQPNTGDSQQWTEAELVTNINNFAAYVRANPNKISGWTFFGYNDYSTNYWYGITRTNGTHKAAYAALAAVAND